MPSIKSRRTPPTGHQRHNNRRSGLRADSLGRTWTTRQLTSDPSGYSIRPVTPRGLRGANRILYVWGDERTVGFRDYTTRLHVLDF
jgi:hypothetical protein